MKFRDRNAETVAMVENLCLILSLGAIFIQIWVLMSAVQSYFQEKYTFLGPSLLLSALCLVCCGLTAFTTTFEPEPRKKRGEEAAREKI